MPKVTKSGEYVSATPSKNERKRKKPLTPEEKECIISRLENLQVNWSEKEIEQQKQNLTNDPIIVGSPIPQDITKNKKIKEIISDLFCIHEKVIIKDGYKICIKCKAKWKVNYNVGTSKSK